VREYLAKIGRRGGLVSRRELSKSHARQMVAIREMRRAAIKAGKPWPPRNRKLLTLSLIQFKFIHHKPVMMHAVHDDWEPLAIVRAREKAEKTLGAKFNIRAFHDAVLELGSVPLPVVTARIDRFIAEGGKGPYPDME